METSSGFLHFGYGSRMKTILLASALALVACSKKEEGAAGGGDPCGTAINAAVDKMKASQGKDAPPAMAEISEKLRTLMTQHCRDDKWPADVIDCFSKASNQPSIKQCRQKLPQDMQQKLQTDIIKVMSAGARDNVRERGMGHGGMGGGSGGASGGGEPAGSAGSDVPPGTKQ